MNVALAYPGCHRWGGVERVMLECANFLARRGHSTHVYASDWDPEAVHPEIVRHPISLPRRPALLRLHSFQQQCARQFAGGKNADVLGAFGVECPMGGVAWVGSVHRAWLEVSSRSRGMAGRLRQRLNLVHPWVLAMERRHFAQRGYRRLVVMTEQIREDLVRFYDVPRADVTVIPNGVSTREFNPQRMRELRAGVRSRLGYRERDRVVVFVANEFDRKGFWPLLRAVAALKREPLHLLAVGRLDPSAAAAEIRRLGLSDRVRFSGSSKDVGTFYAAADLFALPTQYEAWGLVIVEALASGLPVLTSRSAGAAVTVREGETGRLLNDPHSVEEITAGLTALLDGPAPDADRIAASVAPYAWDQVLLQYEELLGQCARIA